MMHAAFRRRFNTDVENFLNRPNVIGRLMIALLFIGGVVYAGAFDGFIVESEASCCCGGGTDAVIFSSSECCDTRTKSCRTNCNQNAAGECGPGNGSLCSEKGDEYEYTGQVEYCCDIDYQNNCEGT